MSTSRKEIESLVSHLSEITGTVLIVDHNSTYGGWVLRRPSGRFGGETDFGPTLRQPAGAFAHGIRLAIAAVYASRHEHTWERRTESGRTTSTWEECRCGTVRPGTEPAR